MTSHDNSNNEKNTIFVAGPILANDGQNSDDSWQNKAIKTLAHPDIAVSDKLAEQHDWEERAIHAYFRQKQKPVE